VSGMTGALRILLYILLGSAGLALVLHLVVRVVRAFYKFPMPQAAAGFGLRNRAGNLLPFTLLFEKER